MERGSLVRLQREYDIDIDWRGFELHPETPEGGLPLDQIVQREMVEPMTRHIHKLAREQGAGEMVVGDHLPNTRRALAVAELARERGRLEAFREAAMTGYWQEGLDLERDDDLRIVLERAGLDPDEGLAARHDAEMLARVDAMRAEATRMGVRGIPTLFFSDEVVIVGAQPFERLARAAEAVGAAQIDNSEGKQ